MDGFRRQLNETLIGAFSPKEQREVQLRMRQTLSSAMRRVTTLRDNGSDIQAFAYAAKGSART
jgi:fructose-1,6-bisphosphatase/inositol monophosphatase family enzyme